MTTWNDACIDWNDLLERLAGDADLAGQVFAVYLDDTPKQLAALREAVAQGDWEEAAKRGHTIKGASANVSAPKARAAAWEVERAAKEGDVSRLPELVAALTAAFEETAAMWRARFG